MPAANGANVLKNEGQRMLLALPQTLQQLAQEVGVRASAIHNYRAGRLPNMEARSRMRYAFGIPIACWDEPPSLTPIPASVAVRGVNPWGAASGTGNVRTGALQPAIPLVTEAPPTPPPPPPPPTDQPPSKRRSALEECLATEKRLRTARENCDPKDLVKYLMAEGRNLALRAQLERQAELSESRYVTNHPAWLALKRVITHALEPFPEAAEAVANAIARIEHG